MLSRTRYTKLIRSLGCAVLISGLVLGLCGCGTAAAQKQAPTHRFTVRSERAGRQRPATGRRVPMPVGNIPGWRQVFTDDFSGSQLDLSKWSVYSGRPGGDQAGWFDPHHVAVSHGMLVISAYRDRADRGHWATGGVSSGQGLVQTYGKYLVRVRFDRGAGVTHALLLWPASNSWPPEIDFSEGNGSGTVGTFATLHYGQQNYRSAAGLPRLNLYQWHTLGVQWTPGEVQYTVDGRVWKTMRGKFVPAIPMVLDLQTQIWPCGSWARCPDATTPRVVRMYVDWVVAYAPAGNTPGAPSTKVDG
jgi:beta-glucanase (GH16 family)